MRALWDENGELNYAVLEPSDAPEHDHFATRRAFTRNRPWSSEVQRMNGSDWVASDEGLVWGIKFKVEHLDSHGGRLHRVYRDSVLVWIPDAKSAAMNATATAGAHVFVLGLIFSGTAMDLPLGYYKVQRKEAGKWRLTAVEAFAAEAEATVAVAAAEAVSAALESSDEGPPQRRRRVEQSDLRPVALRFLAGRDAFDSLLECIHKQAFELLRVQYEVARNQFDLSAALSSRRHYTMDGLMYVRLFTASARLSAVYVEIKPGPLTLLEHELCWAVSRTQNAAVLCVMGGAVERGEPCERERLCPDMSLYLPTGPLAEGKYYPHVAWRWSEPGAAPYLAVNLPADPQQRQREQLRVRLVYAEATVAARRLAEPARSSAR